MSVLLEADGELAGPYGYLSRAERAQCAEVDFLVGLRLFDALQAFETGCAPACLPSALSCLVPADEGFLAGDILLLALVLDELAPALLLLEGAVLGEVAGKGPQIAVVDFQDAGCHLVEEVAVVGYDHEAAAEA